MATAGDVINYAKELWPDFQISLQQLENPTSDFVVSFYQRYRRTTEELNEKVCGSKREQVVPKKPETLFELMRFINKYMTLLTKHANYSESDCKLVITDLYDPTSKRTIIRFKVLLMFLMYYEDQQETFKDCVSRTLQKVEENKLKQAKVDQLMKDNSKAAEELGNYESLLNNLNLKHEKANVRYKELQKQREDHDCHINKLKLDLKAMVDTFETKQSLISNIKTNIQRLNEQIVTLDNYNSLVDLKKNIQENCTKLENTSHALSEAVQCKKPEIDQFERLYNILQNLIKIGEELKAIQLVYTEECQKIQTLRNSINENSELLKSVNEENFKLKESIKAKKEAAQMAALKHKTAKNYIAQNIQEYNKEIEMEEKDMVQQQAEYEEKIETLDNLIQGVKDSISVLNTVYQTQYKLLLESENKIASSFNEKIKNLTELLKSNCNF